MAEGKAGLVLFGFFLVCSAGLAFAILLLALIGKRVRVESRVLGVVLAAAVYFAAGWITSEIWALSPAPVDAAEVYCFALTVIVVMLRPVWNPIGQLFMGSVIAAALAYLAFAADITFNGNL